MQLSPRFTSASVSPWVATTLPSFTPTITPHPVPQKRHGAFDHLISSAPTPPATGWATAGTLMLAAAAATAAAWAFNTSRRERLTAVLRGPPDVRFARTPYWPRARRRSTRSQPAWRRARHFLVLRGR